MKHHNEWLVNEQAVWALLCGYHPQSARDGLRWEAHQIAMETEMALYDRVRYRNCQARIIVTGDLGNCAQPKHNPHQTE
ncbi:MAG: hypothetical protein C7B47_13985 [Sulfobacillus thermosulfidooxidans]|uniref:Uncharacterized protein n=1 Tax=Sulfobacillus thermosulfidooxidans TaxID=28034 RepID=A0A2T2WRC2_SULTH|nr:MAG: hypothetical protein C7B47_13985 [Sulfobacillus thermosulfidooxidans]